MMMMIYIHEVYPYVFQLWSTAKYLTITMCVSALSMVIQVAILNIYHKVPLDPVPDWLQCVTRCLSCARGNRRVRNAPGRNQQKVDDTKATNVMVGAEMEQTCRRLNTRKFCARCAKWRVYRIVAYLVRTCERSGSMFVKFGIGSSSSFSLWYSWVWSLPPSELSRGNKSTVQNKSVNYIISVGIDCGKVHIYFNWANDLISNH